MRKKKGRTCPRYYYVKTPVSVRSNSALCCRIAAALNDIAVDVRAGISTKGELHAAHNLAMATGAPIKGNWYGDGAGDVEFDCDSMKLSTKLRSPPKGEPDPFPFLEKRGQTGGRSRKPKGGKLKW